MNRALQKLGLVALAALTMSVAFAPAAQAEPVFASAAGHTYLLGNAKSQNAFTTGTGEIKCMVTKFEGTQLGSEAPTMKVHPTYESCTGFGFPASIDTKACQYELSAGGTLTIGSCPSTAPITISIPAIGCSITIANQGPLSSYSYANEGSPSSIAMTAKVTGITYTSSGGLCGSSGTNGTYSGSVLTKGFSDAAHTTQVGIELLAAAAKPKFGVFINPAGTHFELNQTKKVKVVDEGAAEENWTLNEVLLFEEIGKTGFWELSEGGNCLNKAVEGGKGFSCEVSVKCKKAGAIAYFVVKWTNAKGRKGESFFGPLEC